MQKQNKGLIITCIVLVIALGIAVYDLFNNNTIIKEKEAQIEGIFKENKVLESAVSSLEDKLEGTNRNIVIKTEEISDLKEEISKLRNDAKDINDSVDNITDEQLQQFFTNRY